MAINPMQLMQLKERFEIFASQHPKFIPFVRLMNQKAIKVGTVLEVKVMTPEGESYVSNIKLTEEDLKTIQMFAKG